MFGPLVTRCAFGSHMLVRLGGGGSVTFATRLMPGRYDGGEQYRVMFFDDGCTCYRFTGSNHPVPG